MKPLLFLALAAIATAKPPVIDDTALLSAFEKGVGEFSGIEGSRSSEELSKELEAAPPTAKGLKLATESPASADSAVYIVGSVYKCGKCDKWHSGSVASAWALTADGVMVTNYHVFGRAKGAVMGVSDLKGNTYPITGILAASKADDIAIFGTTATGIAAFPLGPDAEVGSAVQVISHPKQRFFTRTTGIVSRYHARPANKGSAPAVWMSITADYAVGSSGGPVLDRRNRIVGMVSSTQSIHFGADKAGESQGALQMVVKNCVPGSAIRAMLAPE